MAIFTITTTQNIDSLVWKTGGDTYNINWWLLIVDQDSRVWLNQTTSSTLWPVNLSATLWWQILKDWRQIRMIPYSSW
jgi:hypothetical protein